MISALNTDFLGSYLASLSISFPPGKLYRAPCLSAHSALFLRVLGASCGCSPLAPGSQGSSLPGNCPCQQQMPAVGNASQRTGASQAVSLTPKKLGSSRVSNSFSSDLLSLDITTPSASTCGRWTPSHRGPSPGVRHGSNQELGGRVTETTLFSPPHPPAMYL